MSNEYPTILPSRESVSGVKERVEKFLADQRDRFGRNDPSRVEDYLRHRMFLMVDEPFQTFDEKSSVGKNERTIEPVDDQARNGLGGIVVAGQIIATLLKQTADRLAGAEVTIEDEDFRVTVRRTEERATVGPVLAP